MAESIQKEGTHHDDEQLGPPPPAAAAAAPPVSLPLAPLPVDPDTPEAEQPKGSARKKKPSAKKRGDAGPAGSPAPASTPGGPGSSVLALAPPRAFFSRTRYPCNSLVSAAIFLSRCSTRLSCHGIAEQYMRMRIWVSM